MVINPSVPAKTIPEFVAYAKANSGKVDIAPRREIGGIGHLAGEYLIMMMTGVKLLHVPYRGNGPALQALLAGNVDVLFPSLASAIAYIKAGKLRGLGVTSATRAAAMPELPSISESVPGYGPQHIIQPGAPRHTSSTKCQRPAFRADFPP